MLLRSIKLQNFRQYRGEQRITFSCDESGMSLLYSEITRVAKQHLYKRLIGHYMEPMNFPAKI